MPRRFEALLSVYVKPWNVVHQYNRGGVASRLNDCALELHCGLSYSGAASTYRGWYCKSVGDYVDMGQSTTDDLS